MEVYGFGEALWPFLVPSESPMIVDHFRERVLEFLNNYVKPKVALNPQSGVKVEEDKDVVTISGPQFISMTLMDEIASELDRLQISHRKDTYRISPAHMVQKPDRILIYFHPDDRRLITWRPPTRES